jgi:hypothetical protein
MKFLITFLVAFLLAGCGRETVSSGANWHADLSVLEELSTIQPDEKVIQGKMVTLYEAIRDGDWNAVYDMRTEDFRNTVNRDMFTKEGSALHYSFTGYEVLRNSAYVSPGEREKRRFIVRFHINGRETYNVVWWIREGRIWNVENLGFETPEFGFESSMSQPGRQK